MRSPYCLPQVLAACLVALPACGSAGSATVHASSPPVLSPRAVSSSPTVVLDPGHNGANASHSAEINRLVPDGRGGTKACNTTGTSTNSGYPEHEFDWDVALRVRDVLT
ncbi:MAG: N-acetylmuramoyl-L-alanine amidase, partial [Actinomycetota bacterium]|nr:N-acetylmuramoyl-L-alanine amidase [Actinomycetota bacterium]